MAISVVRLGSPREGGEGLRLGTVRRPPRGVSKQDYSRRDYFDLWIPELAPSAALVKAALSVPFTPARWARFARKYRQEMRAPAAQRLLLLLAALSSTTNLSVGCYCAEESRCHRSILREILNELGAALHPQPEQESTPQTTSNRRG
jgi:uncharacterized protein YeaO (DUF488 family)